MLVSTKLDTKIPQFSSGADIEGFLRPSGVQLDSGCMSGAPFFTAVPRRARRAPARGVGREALGGLGSGGGVLREG